MHGGGEMLCIVLSATPCTYSYAIRRKKNVKKWNVTRKRIHDQLLRTNTGQIYSDTSHSREGLGVVVPQLKSLNEIQWKTRMRHPLLQGDLDERITMTHLCELLAQLQKSRRGRSCSNLIKIESKLGQRHTNPLLLLILFFLVDIIPCTRETPFLVIYSWILFASIK